MSQLSVQVAESLVFSVCIVGFSQDTSALWKKESFQLKYVKGSQDL